MIAGNVLGRPFSASAPSEGCLPSSVSSGTFLTACVALSTYAAEKEKKVERDYPFYPPAPAAQTPQMAMEKSLGCLSCHEDTDAKSMHSNPGVVLGCVDCHGGDAGVSIADGLPRETPEYTAAMEKAHVLPQYVDSWHYPSSANPEASYTLLNRESPEFVRFVNPSDYRIVEEACGACHMSTIQAAKRSIMATGAMLWGGAAYNNGILPFKNYLLGEAYTREGKPAGLRARRSRRRSSPKKSMELHLNCYPPRLGNRQTRGHL